jgi:hypothetical protein
MKPYFVACFIFFIFLLFLYAIVFVLLLILPPLLTVGRGIFGKPWLWSESTPSFRRQIEILEEHLTLYNELAFGNKNYNVMKKHFTGLFILDVHYLLAYL